MEGNAFWDAIGSLIASSFKDYWAHYGRKQKIFVDILKYLGKSSTPDDIS